MKTCAVTLLLIAAGTGAADEKKDKAVAEELKRLEGEWRIVAAELGGEPSASTDTVVFAGRTCTVINPDTKLVFENTIAIDPSKSPKRIEVTNTKTKQTWVGIYELRGDTLWAVMVGGNAKAPTEFKTRKGTAEVMFTYERVKPK